MLARVLSAAVNGIEAFPIEVEVNSGWGGIQSSSASPCFHQPSLNYVNQMGCHVDLDLMKAALQALLEVTEKLTVFNEVLDVDEDPH